MQSDTTYSQQTLSGITLLDLVSVFWEAKLLIVISTTVACIIALVIAYITPPTYRASALVVPIDASLSSNGGQAALGQIAGMDLLFPRLGSSNAVSRSIAVLDSRLFALQFVRENDLLPHLFSDRWDEEARAWMSTEGSVTAEPAEWEIFTKFDGMLSVTNEIDTGLITISLDWKDPVQAANWTNKLIQDVNLQLRNNDVSEARKSLEYLSDQLEKTSVVEMRQALYRLIEAQTRTIMLASVREEYVFDVIDPAVVPEFRISPRRKIILLGGFALGMLFGFTVALIRYIYKVSYLGKPGPSVESTS